MNQCTDTQFANILNKLSRPALHRLLNLIREMVGEDVKTMREHNCNSPFKYEVGKPAAKTSSAIFGKGRS